jgi:hypothetical protein
VDYAADRDHVDEPMQPLPRLRAEPRTCASVDVIASGISSTNA